MHYEEGKAKFIQSWGTLGSAWGINKAMGQIHALLLISEDSLSTEEIMEELKISRGNANMNIRGLIDWGIVTKVYKPGERKEYFTAGKDILELARQVSRERRRREIEPVMRVLNEIQGVNEGDERDIEHFKTVTKDLGEFTKQVDGALDKFSRSDKNWFFQVLMKMMR
ncbi:GbsR/MarR family transcriptional regulator [Roseivirga misakiensis]|uniref:HTH-type transcriptional regulator n=1 Tax=Roseivirga misakiensis TaxID=1563681 RepID=A0A1E5SKR3_9BACT|nr:transcriptional regulator [Roseivirga misakiensis]OEJ99718.1 transcriptional regulator [Roseivirga misakiensis]